MNREEPRTRQQRSTIVALLAVLVVIASAYTLRALYYFSMPLVVSILLVTLFRPLQVRLRRHLPRRLSWVGVVAIVLIILAVFAVAVFAAWFSVDTISAEAPKYQSRVSAGFSSFRSVLTVLVLLLFEVDVWRRKISRSFGREQSEAVIDTFNVISGKVVRFLVIRVLISGLQGVATGLVCWFKGIDFPLVWGSWVFSSPCR